MNFGKLMKKMMPSRKKDAKTREERDFIRMQEDSKRKAIDILKRCADELEDIGYFLQPLIALDEETRVSHSSGMMCRASLEITPMNFETYQDIKREKEDNATRETLACEKEGCGKPHTKCTDELTSNLCGLAGIEMCGKCAAFRRAEVKKAEEQKAAETAEKETAGGKETT